MTSHASWFSQNFHLLTDHGNWAQGPFLNGLNEGDFERRPYRLLIVRLSTFEDTAESITHRLLYAALAANPDIYVDVAFLPPPKDRILLSEAGIPWLFGVQTKRPALDFDGIALSNSIVQELINIVPLFDASGLVLDRNERIQDTTQPLVVLGGANATNTSMLWHEASSVDGVFLGESLLQIGALFGLCAQGKLAGKTKEQIIDECTRSIKGFFKSDSFPLVQVAHDTLPESAALEPALPVWNCPEQLGREVLQISEGCPCFCSFCSESWLRKPYREMGGSTAIAIAKKAKALMGCDRVDLYSFNFNMYASLYPILLTLAETFPLISPKSQRFDMLAHDPDLSSFLQVIGKTSITCGLEGISPRLRRYLSKSLSDEDLYKSISLITSTVVREFKIFVIATGLENEGDHKEFKKLLDVVKEVFVRAGKKPRVIVSCTPLVRFPCTPLEFADAPAPEAVVAAMNTMSVIVNGRGFEFRKAMEPQEYLISQILVRAADVRVWNALVTAQRTTSFIYYREITNDFRRSFMDALAGQGLSYDAVLAGHATDTAVAWSGIDLGVTRQFVIDRWECAQEHVDAGYCLGLFEGEGTCKSCGACTPQEQGAIIAKRQKSPYRPHVLKEKTKLWNITESVSFTVDLAESTRTLDRKAIGVALASALMQTDPNLIDLYKGYETSYWEEQGSSRWMWGLDAITLAFRKPGAACAQRILSTPEMLQEVQKKFAPFGQILLAQKSLPQMSLMAEFHAPFALDPARFLDALRLKHTRRKEADGVYRYEIAKDAQKKGYCSHIACTFTDAGTYGAIQLGPKFSPSEFLKQCIPDEFKDAWMQVRMQIKNAPDMP